MGGDDHWTGRWGGGIVHFDSDFARAVRAAEVEVQRAGAAVESEIAMGGVIGKVAQGLKTNARQPALHTRPIAGQRVDEIVQLAHAEVAPARGGEVADDAVE